MAAVEAQAALSLPEGVDQYVEEASGQHRHRPDVLLVRTGLNGLDPITGREGVARLGRSPTRMQQIRDQLLRNRDRARPPAGTWMPQIGLAVIDGWPDEYTDAGVEATKRFFRVVCPGVDPARSGDQDSGACK